MNLGERVPSPSGSASHVANHESSSVGATVTTPLPLSIQNPKDF